MIRRAKASSAKSSPRSIFHMLASFHTISIPGGSPGFRCSRSCPGCHCVCRSRCYGFLGLSVWWTRGWGSSFLCHQYQMSGKKPYVCYSFSNRCSRRTRNALELRILEHPGGPWAPVPGGNGIVPQAEAQSAPAGEVQLPDVELTGLEPEVPYYVRGFLTNSSGAASGEATCETVPLRPDARVEQSNNATATTVHLAGKVEPRGFATHWHFEYAEAEAGPWTPVPGGAGSISQAEAEAIPVTGAAIHVEALLTDLTPASTYYTRLVAESEPEWPQGSGTREHEEATSSGTSIETAGPPIVTTFAVHALDGESPRVLGTINPHSNPTSEEQEITIGGAPTGGSFALTFNGQITRFTATGAVTSGSPTITIALPLAKGLGDVTKGSVLIANVTDSLGEFREGGTISGPGIPEGAEIKKISDSTLEFFARGAPATATTTGAELSSTGQVPFRIGEAINGAGIPTNTTITKTSEEPSAGNGTLTLSANATATSTGVVLTAEIPFDAGAETVARALHSLPSEPEIAVFGPVGGPYKVRFIANDGEQNQSQIEGDASSLTPSGSIAVATTQRGGEAYDTHYHFEYTTSDFKMCGTPANPACLVTPEVDLGSGSPKFVGADLPNLKAGETYRYRIVATNNSVGNPIVDSNEQAFIAPSSIQVGSSEGCVNESLRGGLSARLPDCRAYEQVTPIDKEGAEDIFTSTVYNEGALVGEDGDHAMLRKAALQWGPSPDPKNSNYFFTRNPRAGWQLTSARPPGETGPNSYVPSLYNSSLTDVDVELFWQTSQLETGISPTVELETGPSGGPYVHVATLPHSSVSSNGAWVAASADLSRSVFQTSDRVVASAHKSSTASGFDLYEYTAQGGVHQLNVNSEGRTIGSCGATMVNGGAEHAGKVSSAHAVSADGSRAFFEAIPTSNCSEATNLYMRIDGKETVDIGAYRFLASNAQRTELLLEAQTTRETVLYDVEARGATVLPGVNPAGARISADFSTVYFGSSESLTPEAPSGGSEATYYYRFDIATKTLRYLFQLKVYTQGQIRVLGSQEVSPDGRFLTVEGSEVGGIPSGKEGDHLYRYDDASDLVQCLDCGPTYNPVDPNPPRRSSEFGEPSANAAAPSNNAPREVSASSNGDFVFFTTTEALLPADIDTGTDSSDVYEWRANGVDGCAQPQGCLALISGGRDGVRNQLLGIAEEGRDVFFATHEALGPQDQDTAGDIYDARIGGGFRPPESPGVECEGDACSTPLSAPNDVTPSSFTFTGAGNIPAPSTETPVAKPKVKKAGKKTKKAKKGKKGAKKRGKAAKGPGKANKRSRSSRRGK